MRLVAAKPGTPYRYNSCKFVILFPFQQRRVNHVAGMGTNNALLLAVSCPHPIAIERAAMEPRVNVLDQIAHTPTQS